MYLFFTLQSFTRGYLYRKGAQVITGHGWSTAKREWQEVNHNRRDAIWTPSRYQKLIFYRGLRPGG